MEEVKRTPGFDEWAQKALKLDGGERPYFSDDQVGVVMSERFATVTFIVKPTPELFRAAEAARAETDGPEGWKDTRCDGDYQYTIGIGRVCGKDVADSCISVWDCVTEQEYLLQVPDDAREGLYELLDGQAKEVYGKSCGKMLDEAWEKMEEYYTAKDVYTDYWKEELDGEEPER